MNRLQSMILVVAMMLPLSTRAKSYTLSSPNDQLIAMVEITDDITLSIRSADGDTILAPSMISMDVLVDGKLQRLAGGVLEGVERTKEDKQVKAGIYHKRMLRDNYNQMAMRFRADYSILFRVYDSGVAYRFESDFDEDIIVIDEHAHFRFDNNYLAWVGYVNRPPYLTPVVEGDLSTQYMSSFESVYRRERLDSIANDKLIYTPVVVGDPKHRKVLIGESDVRDYPAMLLLGGGDKSLKAHFAPYPTELLVGGYRNLQEVVVERAPFIAKVDGERSYPWRIVEVAKSDVELLESDLVYLLAEPCQLEDISWIVPGKVAWDWWNDMNLEGVDFVAGINTPTYKYYIDFAAANGIEYVILDEGWAEVGQSDLRRVIPEIDLEELIDYANARGVDIILWAGYWALAQDMESLMEHYAKMGVKGFKIDFMDRDDQLMIAFMEDAAEEAAKHHLMLNFHGSTKPTGMQRTYPNVINFEAVSGLEQLKWQERGYDQVTYDVEIPFIRMTAGPLDYTQGAMRNATEADYYPSFSNPMSQGTRGHQMATYVIFTSPMNMLSDSPTNYEKEQESLQFITEIPTTWDEMVALGGELSEYVIIARRKGDVWYVGALNNWSERDVVIDLSFLGSGAWSAEIFQDGVNANRKATDYKIVTRDVTSNDLLDIRLMQGGGAAIRLTPR